MRHARPEALDELETMLEQLRGLPGLTEKTRGTFHRGSRAFLHFHEDPSGHHMDVRLQDDFERFRVQTKAEQRAALSKVKRALAD